MLKRIQISSIIHVIRNQKNNNRQTSTSHMSRQFPGINNYLRHFRTKELYIECPLLLEQP